jgi:hypothetical protein
MPKSGKVYRISSTGGDDRQNAMRPHDVDLASNVHDNTSYGASGDPEEQK